MAHTHSFSISTYCTVSGSFVFPIFHYSSSVAVFRCGNSEVSACKHVVQLLSELAVPHSERVVLPLLFELFEWSWLTILDNRCTDSQGPLICTLSVKKQQEGGYLIGDAARVGLAELG